MPAFPSLNWASHLRAKDCITHATGYTVLGHDLSLFVYLVQTNQSHDVIFLVETSGW